MRESLQGMSGAFFRAANRVVVPILRSRLHFLLSGPLMLITYIGPRTGRERTLPVAFYFWYPDEIWAFCARSGWASSLRDHRTVRLLIRGREFVAVPTVVEEPEEVAACLREFVRRKGPGASMDPNLALPRNREPTEAETLATASRARLVRFRVRT